MTSTRAGGMIPEFGEAARVMMLPATALSPLAARDFARDTLHQWHLSESCDVVLIVNELVTNAVIHAAGTVTLTLDLHDGVVHIMVGDEATGVPIRRDRDTSAEEGRGLALVTAMSLMWGVHERAGGKTVWADVAVPA
jgi:anti-sigma regulatory factor (Ser/Thr protein kinase)